MTRDEPFGCAVAGLAVGQADIQMSQPVLLLVFNRPDTTKVVFDAIRASRPPRLYVASDGARPTRDGESSVVQMVRNLSTDVDWDCDVFTLFREENLGCRRAVSGALDWFFAHEECGIVLEDDCVPDPSFFQFADETLHRFAHDERVMLISGIYPVLGGYKNSNSYLFSRYVDCWGWASWRRAWHLYDHDMALWPALRDTAWLSSIGGGSRLFVRYWRGIFDAAYSGAIDSWAYRWLFSCWAQHGLAVVPAYNLVQNIGFGSNATHTFDGGSSLAKADLQQMSFPLVHPNGMTCDPSFDRWVDQNVFGITLRAALKDQVRALPGGDLLAAGYHKLRSIGK